MAEHEGNDRPVSASERSDDRDTDSDSDGAWRRVTTDPLLSRPPAPGRPGDVPPGENLRLDIGWERFEQLLGFVAEGALGLSQVRFRRYGVSGQEQHGIDLAGRRPDGTHTVIQCKHHADLTPGDLRRAVEKFAEGRRPFGSKHLIVAVSSEARTTQLEDALAQLQDEHSDIRIELWGAEEINDTLRNRADIVSRFWTRETAASFCSGAPLPGVDAPPPNWVRVADQILLSPLGVDGLDDQLAEAEELVGSDPAVAALSFERLADGLAADGFEGHAHVLRRKQLDALVDAQEVGAAASLAGYLASIALHRGDIHQARVLSDRLAKMVREEDEGPSSHRAEEGADGHVVSATRHAKLIRSARQAAEHPLGDNNSLADALRQAVTEGQSPDYLPILVLLLGELTIADTTVAPSDELTIEPAGDGRGGVEPAVADGLASIDDLVTSAIGLLAGLTAPVTENKDLLLRLRALRAVHDEEERTRLLTDARQLRLPRTHAALVLATQARRFALDGSPEEALECWRQAVGHAIHAGHTSDASGWLYSIRAVNTRYGPWTNRIDEEHLLAQALPQSTGGRLIQRPRDPETDARRAALNDRHTEAIRATRRWIADSVMTGDWVGEHAAVELLGDLYANNAEPDRAAACYQWVGQTKKLTALAEAEGDRLLPFAPIGTGPWWKQTSSLAGIAVQHDLIEDDTAGALVPALIDLVARGRSGELIDSPTHSLTHQATKTVAVLASRGESADAKGLLDLFAGDVARAPNRYHRHDREHVQACRSIAAHHPDLAWPAIVRLFDLAEAGTDDALSALTQDWVIDILDESTGHDAAPTEARKPSIDHSQRQQLRERLRAMAADGRYNAAVTLAAIGEVTGAARDFAILARDRLLNRSEPDGKSASYGSRMVSDAYLVATIGVEGQRTCLEKMLEVAADRRETAPNRQDALVAACNLAHDEDEDTRATVHKRSRSFVTGDQDGSFLDDQTTNPHPLSAFKVSLGSPSLRSPGLRLALVTATSEDDRRWVRDQAVNLLRSSDRAAIRGAATTLYQLGDMTDDLDPTLLAGHSAPVVRQLGGHIAARAPAKYALALRTLTKDPDRTVRKNLARRLHQAQVETRLAASASDDEGTEGDDRTVILEMLETLSRDSSHSVRSVAAGADI